MHVIRYVTTSYEAMIFLLNISILAFKGVITTKIWRATMRFKMVIHDQKEEVSWRSLSMQSRGMILKLQWRSDSHDLTFLSLLEQIFLLILLLDFSTNTNPNWAIMILWICFGVLFLKTLKSLISHLNYSSDFMEFQKNLKKYPNSLWIWPLFTNILVNSWLNLQIG